MANESRTEAGDAPPGRGPDQIPRKEPGDARASAAEAFVDELRTLHLWQFQPVRDLLLIALVVGTVYAGYALRTVTVPLLVALALAYLVEPIVSWLTRARRLSRPGAVLILLGVLSLLVAAVVGIVAPIVVGQTLSFAQNLRAGRFDGTLSRLVDAMPSEYRDEARHWVDRLIHPAAPSPPATEEQKPASISESEPPSGVAPAPEAGPTPEPAADEFAPAIPAPVVPVRETLGSVDLGNPLVSILGRGAAQAYDVAIVLVKLGLVLFLIPFYFYYFSVHWPSIVGFFADLVPDERRKATEELVREMDRAVAGFVRGRITIAFLMGILFAIGWQACGVPYGLALGFLTGVLSIVPYLGGIGLPVAVGLLVADQFAQPEAERMAIWAMLVWPTAVFVAVQTIEGYLLTPVIAGKATNLDPVTIVVAILAGGSLAGVYGMLLAIPIAACGKIAARRLLLPRIRDWVRGRVSDPLPIDSE